MTVKRYGPRKYAEDVAMFECDDGQYVSLYDYQTLKRKLELCKHQRDTETNYILTYHGHDEKSIQTEIKYLNYELEKIK